jgi:hypothetical protein
MKGALPVFVWVRREQCLYIVSKTKQCVLVAANIVKADMKPPFSKTRTPSRASLED